MLQHKVILITGAASGIGEAAAHCFADVGARLVLLDRNLTPLEAVGNDVAATGAEVAVVVGDVTSEADVDAAVGTAISRFGRLDGAFNNAGVGPHNLPIDELTIEAWDRVMNIDLKGMFLCVRAELRAMLPTGGGAIVLNSSTLGMMGKDMMAEYASAKHGVIGLMRSASAEFGRTGVRVNAVLPGLTRTPLVAREEGESIPPSLAALQERTSIPRIGEAIDVARAAKWLLSEEAAFINGVSLPVDGGYAAR